MQTTNQNLVAWTYFQRAAAGYVCLAIILLSVARGDSPAQPSPIDSQKLLTVAIEKAQREHKRIYLLETSDHCFGCRLMSRFLERYKTIIDQEFVIVTLNRRDEEAVDPVIQKYRAACPGGIPWVAILDQDGGLLATTSDADGKNMGFPTGPDKVERFTKMISLKSKRITSSQLQEIELSLVRQELLSEMLGERDAARAKSEIREDRPEKH